MKTTAKRTGVCFGMPLRPADYAEQLVDKLGFLGPPILEIAALDHLGLKRKSFTGSEFFGPEGFEDDDEEDNGIIQTRMWTVIPQVQGQSQPKRRHRKLVDAALRGNIVWVDSEIRVERQRTAVAHECGHKVIPWHLGLDYFHNGCLADTAGPSLARKHREQEQEANEFASHFLMPRRFFQADMNSLPFGIRSLEEIARRYETSMESTGIHYVALAQSPCAFVIVEPWTPSNIAGNSSSLRVRYSIHSPFFDHFIKPKTEIPADSPIARMSFAVPGTVEIGEVSGSVLGLRPDRRLVLHCRSWGNDGDVMILVWEPRAAQPALFLGDD